MIDPINSASSDMPTITSLDEFYSVVFVLGQNTIKFCERLAGEARRCKNEDTAEVFDDLALRENARVQVIRNLANQTGAEIITEGHEFWSEQDLRDDLAREISDNPYLMTPYRALCLAVINKERVFEIISTLAANQVNDLIRHHAESFAQDELTEIADLRLRRRRASRSEIKTAIDKAGFNTPSIEMDNFNKTVEAVHAIIRTMTLVIRENWASELSDDAKQALEELLADFDYFPDVLVEDADRDVLEVGILQENDTLFSALKSLLRELESTVDLFLSFAEKAGSEDVVAAAQSKAERYVQRIARIRDQLILIGQN